MDDDPAALEEFRQAMRELSKVATHGAEALRVLADACRGAGPVDGLAGELYES